MLNSIGGKSIGQSPNTFTQPATGYPPRSPQLRTSSPATKRLGLRQSPEPFSWNSLPRSANNGMFGGTSNAYPFASAASSWGSSGGNSGGSGGNDTSSRAAGRSSQSLESQRGRVDEGDEAMHLGLLLGQSTQDTATSSPPHQRGQTQPPSPDVAFMEREEPWGQRDGLG